MQFANPVVTNNLPSVNPTVNWNNQQTAYQPQPPAQPIAYQTQQLLRPQQSVQFQLPAGVVAAPPRSPLPDLYFPQSQTQPAPTQ